MNKRDKPCPFCNSRNVRPVYKYNADMIYHIAYIECVDCKARGAMQVEDSHSKVLKLAWKKWNERQYDKGKHIMYGIYDLNTDRLCCSKYFTQQCRAKAYYDTLSETVAKHTRIVKMMCEILKVPKKDKGETKR